MAESIVTPGTESNPMLGLYGPDSPIAAAFRRFNPEGFAAIDAARQLDTARLVLSIARRMAVLMDRQQTIAEAFDSVVQLLPGSTDGDMARAVATMAGPFQNATTDDAFELCGEMLAALERSGMLVAAANTN